MKDLIGALLIIGGAVVAGIGVITGIGVGLYNWGALELPLWVSAWTGFVMTLKMWGIGLTAFAVGAIMEAV